MSIHISEVMNAPLWAYGGLHDFDPPYDSPIETVFAWHFHKRLGEQVQMSKQCRFETFAGNFRVDFVVTDEFGRNIGIETDGRDFHDTWRDEWRDALILGEEHLDAMIRIRGQDIYYHIEDVVYAISQWEPTLFSERGMIQARTLASDRAKASLTVGPHLAVVAYLEINKGNPASLFLRRATAIDIDDKRQFWKHLYRFAVEDGGEKLDAIIDRYVPDEQTVA